MAAFCHGPVDKMDADGPMPTSPTGSDSPRDGWKGKGDEENEDKAESETEKEATKWDDQGKDVDRGEDDCLHIDELEPRAMVKFQKLTFFMEFIYHTFFPLTVPLMYYMDGGWYSLHNRGFIGWENRYLAASQLFWALNFYVINAVALRYINQADGYGYLNDVGLVDLLWFMRNMVVATKYAFLPLAEMEEMRTKKVPSAVHHFRTLLIAWRDPIPGRVLKYELLLAALRNKLTIKKSSFRLDSVVDSTQAIRDLVLDLRLAKQHDNTNLSLSYGKRAHRWLAVGTEELCKDPLAWAEVGGVENLTHLPARLYTAHVIRQASSLSRLKRLGHNLLSAHLRPFASILALLHAIIPLVGRKLFGGYPIPGPAWAKYCILVPSFFLMTFAMMSNLGFMMIGVLDFRRRHFIAESLDDLLRTAVYTGSQHVRIPSSNSIKYRETFMGLMPSWASSTRRGDFSTRSGSSSGALSGAGIFFDFSQPDSLLAWWTCRQLMSNFGFGFYKRIKYYTTYFAGYCVILLVFLVVKTLGGIAKNDIYMLITVVFSINVFLSLLALMVWPGGDTNNTLARHGTTLIRRKIGAQMRMIKEGKHLKIDDEVKTTRASIETLNSIVEAVKWDNSKIKLSICGFEARDQLVSLIVAIVTASMSIGIGQIVQNGLTL